MDYQMKIYFLLGVLLVINVVVFVLNSMLSIKDLSKKREVGSFCGKRRGEYVCIDMEDIVDHDYYLIEGCVFSRGKERYGSFLSRRKRS